MLKKSDAVRNAPSLVALEDEIRELERKREARRQQRQLAPGAVAVPLLPALAQSPDKTADETWSVRAAAEPAPKRNRELLTAHEITRRGEHELGIRYEPPRVCRRPSGLSYVAMAGSSSMA